MEVKTHSYWKRWWIWICVAIIFLPLISIYVVTRSFILTPLIERVLENELGTEVHVSRSVWQWDGGVVLDEVVLKANSIQGEAADVIALLNVSVGLDTVTPLFNPAITSIDIDSIRIRLAESATNPGEFNFSNLLASDKIELPSLESSESDRVTSADSTTPMVVLQKLVVETGLMENGNWTLDNSKTFTVSGITQEESSTALQLIDAEDTLTIHLEIETSPFEVGAEIDDVQFGNSIFSLLPRTARTWCEETQLKGGIESLDITWDSAQGIQIDAAIQNIQFQLPEEHGVPWGSYKDGVVKRIRGDASLDVKKGNISYDGENVILRGITGNLLPPQQAHTESLHFTAEMKIYDFQSVGEQAGDEWMNSMLSNSPFKATFVIHDFSPIEGKPGEVRVPLAAAQMLKIFQLKHWNMNAEVSIGRTVRGGDIDVHGDLSIQAEAGKYVDFPYPLSNIRSEIIFHQNEIQIVDLKADGSEAAKIGIKGTVVTSEDDLLVELDLVAANAPIDSSLRAAVSTQLATVMDRMIDTEAYAEIAELIDSTYASRFELGGELDLKLSIVHDSNIASGVRTTGEIAIKDIGILHNEFPYPILLREGSVTLNEEGLHILDSPVKIEGYGGGRGFLDGSILFWEDGPAPAIAFKLDGEKVTSALVGAVIDSAGEENELAAGILSGLGLTSDMSLTGTILGGDEGEINTTFNIDLLDGVAVPNSKLADAIGVSGSFWPEDFKITNINTRIEVTNSKVMIEKVTGQCGDGFLSAALNIDKGDLDLHLQGDSLPLSPRFAAVLPQGTSETLSDAWSWLNPTGSMNATIRMAKSSEDSHLHMNLEPILINVNGDNRRTSLRLTKGSIVAEDSEVFFNDLIFELSETGEHQGVLEITGEVGGELEAYWDKVAIDSPMTRAITGIAGGPQAVKYFDAMHPAGKAKARAMMRASDEHGGIAYSIEIEPSDLSATFHKRRAIAKFDSTNANSKNLIRFDNQGMHFENLLGTLGAGNFELEGEILSNESVDGAFDLTWSGPTGDESLFAVLPSAVGDVLVAIELKDGVSTLPNGEVHFSGESWKELIVEFKGDISLEDVAMDVGIPLVEIQGSAHLEGEYSNDQLAALDMSIAFEEMSTLGRLITDVAGSLEFNSSENQLTFEEMRGESTTGSVTVDGWIGLHSLKEYEIEILIAGVALESGEGDGIVASLEGELVGLFSIAGIRGEPASRRGVGSIRVENGHLEINPLSLTTMRVLQLALPSASAITGADIDLFIEGDTIVLKEISLRSSDKDVTGFKLEGEGVIDFDTFEIEARLHPRAGLPVLREITGLLNDHLYSIDVTGKLLDPKVSVVPLPFLSPQDN